MKSFLLKSVIVVIMYIPLQRLYYYYTNDADASTPLYLKVEKNKNDYAEAEMVSFGSSVEYMSHPKDKDRRTMTERLETYLPNKKIVQLSQAAFTVKILDAFIKYYHKKVNGVKQFYIIELNMDQFSVTDNSRFLDRTPERLSYGRDFRAALYKPLSIFNYDYGVLTEQEFKDQEIYLDGEYQGLYNELFNGQDLTAKQVYRNRYMIQYLYHLDEENEKIGYLRNLISFLIQEDIDCLFYITPFDHESCTKYFEVTLCNEIIDSNIKYLTDILDESGMDYLNLTKDVPTSYIATTAMAPNCHLKSEGKEYNAKKISEWVNMNLSSPN